MQATAKFVLDRTYFEEAFGEWLRHRSRFRKFQTKLGVTMAVVGLGLAVLAPGLRAAALIFGACGLVEWAEFYWYRARWIRGRLSARGDEPAWAEMTFDASGVQTNGPTATGHLQWQGVRELVATPNGLFIRVGDGMSIYVPGSAVAPSAADILTLATSTAEKPPTVKDLR